ncbi:MAG TPA: BTAD domain-containing putative transcriptional regulator [Anaerolineae bacterium]
MSGLLRLTLLGTFQATVNQEPVTGFAYDKVRALLAYLAVESDYPHRRDALTGLFWPEQSDTAARLSLNQAIYTLRKSLGDKQGNKVPFILTDRTSVQLNPAAAVWLDAREFEKRVTAGSKLETADVQQLQKAIFLYRGDFLRGLSLDDSPAFDDWLALTRERLHRLALEALDYLAQYETRRGQWDQALTYARRQVELEPWREEAHRQIMLLLARTGDYNGALTQYDTCRAVLAEELAIEPMPETASLYRRIVAVRGGDHRHNLPPTTELIGREADLQHLKQLLAHPDKRLISLVGPGGIGKTRLAIEAARQNQYLFLEGVAFVSLAALSEPGQMVPAIASAANFPLRSEARRTPAQQLLDYLQRKEMLLVLDNLEHLLDGVALLADILATAPDVKLLVTSRHQLQLQAEQLFSVVGLDYPKWATQTGFAAEPVEAMASGEAVTYPAGQLFLKAAQRRQPDFALMDSDEQDSVASICQMVEGMPLALELAAAWVDRLSLTEIAAEIRHSLDFLESERRDAPERHHSIRAAFDTSWNLLDDREQAVFAGLSVFRGGFTREAAQAIAGASLRSLSRLVSQSLLQFDRQHGRYQIHELLRQYGAEKLARDIERETATSTTSVQAVRDRHSVYYCAFLHEHTEHWHTAHQLETLAAVTREADNVQVAWRWALAQGEWQRLVQALDSWGWFHDWQGRFADGESFCQAIVEKVERQLGETAVSAHCLRLWAKTLAWLGRFRPGPSAALGVLQQSLTLLERPELARQDTRQEKAFVLASEAWKVSDPDLERLLIEQSLALCRELGNQRGIAQGLSALSHVDWRTGNHDSGLTRAQAALTIHQEQGDRRGQAICMAMLARIHKTLGQLEEAERLEREALSLIQQIGDRSRLVHRHAALAHTLLWQGKFAEAQQLAGESLAICQDLGHRAAKGWAQYCLSEALMHSGQYQPARRQAASGLLVVKAVGSRDDEAALYGVLGQLALVESSYAEAQAAFAKSGEIFRENQYRPFDFSPAGLGYTACRLGQLQEAHQHLVEALASALAVKTYGPTLFALPGVALLLALTGSAARAVEIWALARCHSFVANSRWFEAVAGRELKAVAASLPPEIAEAALERGRTLDLWQTAAALLAELEAMSAPEQDLTAHEY